MTMFSTILALLLFCSSSFSANFTLGFIADGGKLTSKAKSVRESMARKGELRLVMAGDNLYSSDYRTVWADWIAAGFSFDVTAIGNHNDGYANEMAFFKMPGEFFSKVYSSYARFIVLNSDNNGNVKEQMDFLEQELKTAKEKMVFLVYHHPSYTLSHFHKWQEKRDFQLAIRPLLFKYRSKITAVLAGHDHLALVAEFGDLPVIIAGAVQEVRDDVALPTAVQDGVTVKTHWYFDGKPYWTQMKFDSSSDVVTVDYVRATDDQIRCSVFLKTGKPLALDQNCTQ